MKKETFLKISLIVFAVVLAGTSRFISDIPNFSPMLSIALFSGYMFRNKLIAYLLPLSAQLLSDVYFGFHPDIFAVYFSFALIIGLGQLNRKNYSFGKSILWSVVGSILFFILTNFSVWITADFYSKDISGLINCFSMAIPFYKNTILSAIIYSVIMFGSYDLIESFAQKQLKSLEIKNN